jgi:hypothetical protein
MSLFGSAKSGKAADFDVTLASAAGGGKTLIMNGVVYGTAWKGRTKEEDRILVNSELPDEAARAAALVGLTAVMFGKNPQQIAEMISHFHQWNANR